jgi:uncharacterized protein YpmB|tara:strand:+ start:11845 stop:13515 length:1671 start_codon:yes stop_codon:yes gene_type:complete
MKLDSNIKRFSNQGVLCVVFCVLFSLVSAGQVASSIDSTAIKIGEELRYRIQVDVDSTSLVVFSEEQTFQPLEIINSYPIDSTKKGGYYKLTKTYGLTQFDSGVYIIPKQKIIIGDKVFYTDSLKVQVNPVVVDTTKQKLFDIKPITDVQRTRSNLWAYIALVLLTLLAVTGLVYWFFWRKKPLTEAEKIAALPPYERAKLALEKLDEDHYFQNEDVKMFYSDLTLILRQYLDEKVYDQSLESTTDELVFRLKTLQAANQISLGANTIRNIETILKRADLVKFAKSKPDFELAKLDKGTIGLEIKQVKEGLPEPTEEELLQDLEYREALEGKQKRKKQKQIVAGVVGVFVVAITFLIVQSGFTNVKDTVLRNPSKLLLEKTHWVKSEYGAPGITLSTPNVLERQTIKVSEEMKDKVQLVAFACAGKDTPIDVFVTSSKYASVTGKDGKEKEVPIDVLESTEAVLNRFEKEGAKNIISRNEQFITPNGQEGVKTFGTAEFIINDTLTKGVYVVLGFSTPNLLQQVILIWKEDDVYADQIIERILNSIELITLTEEQK